MKRQHTPGPWSVESDGTTVCMAGQCVITAPAPDRASRDEERANARLIAAAPELLEALQAVLREEDRIMDGGRNYLIQRLTFERCRAAISKAEGRADG